MALELKVAYYYSLEIRSVFKTWNCTVLNLHIICMASKSGALIYRTLLIFCASDNIIIQLLVISRPGCNIIARVDVMNYSVDYNIMSYFTQTCKLMQYCVGAYCIVGLVIIIRKH